MLGFTERFSGSDRKLSDIMSVNANIMQVSQELSQL